MNYQRAREIYSSPKEYEISFNGKSVWIDQLHEDKGTATVHPRHEHDKKMEVPIADLTEEYLIH
jgi:small acid-soluble spore protein H (minor)